jgi:hypothetical protein
MWCKIKLNSNLPVGTMVSYNENLQCWDVAENSNNLVGTIQSEPTQNEDTNEWSARTVFAGTTYALANQDIADNGGEFVVINGRVAVGESIGCGIISPLPLGGLTRTEGDLVMIHIR